MSEAGPRIGWIGVGRMGFALAGRLLDAGHDVAVYNRTRAKAEPLAERGAKVVDAPIDLADRDVVFIMVSAPSDLADVTTGEGGLLTASRRCAPHHHRLVDGVDAGVRGAACRGR